MMILLASLGLLIGAIALSIFLITALAVGSAIKAIRILFSFISTFTIAALIIFSVLVGLACIILLPILIPLIFLGTLSWYSLAVFVFVVCMTKVLLA